MTHRTSEVVVTFAPTTGAMLGEVRTSQPAEIGGAVMRARAAQAGGEHGPSVSASTSSRP